MRADELNSWLLDGRRRPLVMGILNVTPDSFSDGGAYMDAEGAAARFQAMAEGGADLIDIGGESTRPGAAPVDAAEQIRRIVPVLRAVASKGGVAVSVDTTRAAVAEAALEAGAAIINDTSAGTDDPAMLPLAAWRGVPVVLMHRPAPPAGMQDNPVYRDVVGEVAAWLGRRVGAAVAAGVGRQQLLLDPGIGFGKTATHNLQLLRGLETLTALGQPLLVGSSRKSFIAGITGETDPADRRWGTAATVAWCLMRGAAIVRVHDVEAAARMARMIRAIGDCPPI